MKEKKGEGGGWFFFRIDFSILLLFWTLLSGLSLQYNHAMLEQQLVQNLHEQGNAVVEILVSMWEWNAGHEGVYVPPSAQGTAHSG